MAVGRVASSLADNSGLQGHQCGGVGADWSDFWYMSGDYELRRGHDASAMCLLPRRTSSLNPQHLTTGSALPIHMRHPALLKITELSASIILPFSSALCRVPLQLSTIAIPSLCCIPFARRPPSREISVSTHDPLPPLLHPRASHARLVPSIAERQGVRASLLFGLLKPEDKVDQDRNKESRADAKRADKKI